MCRHSGAGRNPDLFKILLMRVFWTPPRIESGVTIRRSDDEFSRNLMRRNDRAWKRRILQQITPRFCEDLMYLYVVIAARYHLCKRNPIQFGTMRKTPVPALVEFSKNAVDGRGRISRDAVIGAVRHFPVGITTNPRNHGFAYLPSGPEMRVSCDKIKLPHRCAYAVMSQLWDTMAIVVMVLHARSGGTRVQALVLRGSD